MVTEEIPGRPFDELLASASRATDDLLAVPRPGRRLDPDLSIARDIAGTSVSLAERRAYLDERLKQLEGRVISPAERQAHALALRRRWPHAPAGSGRRCPIHADLGPMNIIVDDTGRIAVLDFTMVKDGTACHDISHLYFHFEMIGARQRKREMMRELQRALLAGYSPSLSDDRPAVPADADAARRLSRSALLGARRVSGLCDLLYRWFVRRRWRRAVRMHQTARVETSAPPD